MLNHSAFPSTTTYLTCPFLPRTQHEVLEPSNFESRQQVVRWTRKFPFSFLSDREYCIARRIFRRDCGLYGVTKVGGRQKEALGFGLRARRLGIS